MSLLRTLAIGLTLLFTLPCCGEPEPQAPPAMSGPQPRIMTSFYPLTWLAERLSVPEIEVVCPLPGDADPALWQPGRDDLRAFQQAGLVLINGANFEQWVHAASLPPSRLVDSSAAFQDQFLRYSGVTHSHGGGAQHTHEGVDGHTWMDPLLLLAQAEAVRDAVVRTWPDHADAVNTAFTSLRSDLQALDQRWSKLAARLRQLRLFSNHPAYRYVARRYQLPMTDFDLDPSAPLNEDAITALREALAQGEGPALIWWEQPPSAANEQRLQQELDLHSVWVSPCESPPQEPSGSDFLRVMNANLLRLERALDQG